MTSPARRTLGRGLLLAGRAFTAAGERVVFDHRDRVGGLWDELGRRQLEFLVEQGLAPTDHLVDVGCGSLRGGLHLVRYLEPGHYSGLDRSSRLVRAGRKELQEAGLGDRGADLRVDGRFGLDAFGHTFDVALAQSLFPHLALDLIRSCLVRVSKALAPGGRLFATFFEQTTPAADRSSLVWSSADGLRVETWPDRDPYHHPPEVFVWLTRDLPLEVHYLGDWGNPRRQRMLCFTRTPSN